MRGFWKLSFVEFKLFLREPSAAFFTLVFPLMMLFLFGAVFGNKPEFFGKTFGTVDLSIPAYTAMIIATTGLVSLTITIAAARELGVLRRFHTTPLIPTAILTSQVLVLFVMTTLGMALLIVAAIITYGLRFNGNVLSVILGFLLSCGSFFSLGFVLASISRTARSAQVMVMALYYPMLFLSGAAIPKYVLPEAVRTYGQILPLTHVVNLLTGLWLGEPWSDHLKEVAVLVVMMVVGLIVSAKTFRWE
jgi:ABC-2 type transport system permease protein